MVIGTCEVCKEKESKYKCPVCAIKFCCVACFKVHKASEKCTKPVSVVEEKPIERKEIEFETEDTVMPEKLELLATDENIKNDLSNPYLRQLLTNINYSENPGKTIQEAMQEPMFVEFVTHCLKLVEDPSRYEDSYVS